MRRALTWLAVISLSVAVDGRTAAQERGLQKVQAEAENALSLSLRVQTKDGTGLRSLTDGETLRTGDVIQFVVAVDQAAYVYIVQYFADGSAAVLHPESGDALLRPGYEARIPEPGHVFKLVPPAGSEVVYFIATRKTLGEADERVAEAVRMIRASDASARPGAGSTRPDSSPLAKAAASAAAAPPPPPSAWAHADAS